MHSATCSIWSREMKLWISGETGAIQVACPSFKPVARNRALTLGAMSVAAGIIGNTHHAAGPAPFDMSTKRGRPA